MTSPLLHSPLPPKSIAGALLFAVFLGPIGLLYASFRGGFFMTIVGVIVACSKLPFPIILVWLISCIWAVGAAERYNRQQTLGFVLNKV